MAFDNILNTLQNAYNKATTKQQKEAIAKQLNDVKQTAAKAKNTAVKTVDVSSKAVSTAKTIENLVENKNKYLIFAGVGLVALLLIFRKI